MIPVIATAGGSRSSRRWGPVSLGGHRGGTLPLPGEQQTWTDDVALPGLQELRRVLRCPLSTIGTACQTSAARAGSRSKRRRSSPKVPPEGTGGGKTRRETT